ncbi:GTPase IMAP family member 8-like [Colossoma macropomum]|uniref:GTPase IMAP family member 8-like n=1 Tax=Colossoma macropomum TaxID=42526 RepID=UPI001863D32C|nr:GTPase IMAP family member 8-like [Colossoma macropomum]XP_036419813.1 GTPase IMAP family member 8-like [Colossoma macropomum]XP_036419814.1 GTPase IMAP family member 8-like [Colossoma macropomum]
MADSSNMSEDLRMVLLGNAGVGKSSTGNAILKREAFRETETTECEIQRGRVENRNISIIDTPAINTTTLSTDQLKTEIEMCISLSSPGPHVFLLVVRVGRFTEKERNTVKWIQENFGEEALKFTMVLFTGREEMSNRQWIQFSQDAKMLELTSNCEFGYYVMNSKREVKPAQITKLLEKIETTVQQNRGQCYTHDMYKAFQKKRILQEEPKEDEKKREEEERKREQESYKQQKGEKGRWEEKWERGEEETRPNMEETETEVELQQSTEDKIHQMLVLTTSTRDDRTQGSMEHPETLSNSKTLNRDTTSQDEVIKTEDQKGGKQLEKEVVQKASESSVKYLKEREKEIEAKSIKEEIQREGERKKQEELRRVTGRNLHDAVSDLRIVLLGTAGAGKSASGNTILGREAFGTDFLNSSTKCKRRDGMVGNKTMTVIDTKGVPQGANFSWCREQFEECMPLCSPGPHVFLLAIRSPTSIWMLENINQLRENFGKEFIKRCIVLLTHGDLDGRDYRETTENLCFEFLEFINSCAGVYHIFNNLERGDRTQVTELLEKIEALVEKNRGRHYTIEMYQKAQRKKTERRKKVEEILEDIETLLDMNSQLMIKAMHLEAHRKNSIAQIKKIQGELEKRRTLEEDRGRSGADRKGIS